MNKPVRLQKAEDPGVSFLQKIDEWAIRNAHIILPICIIIMLLLFVALCYALMGVSATDSGLKYNHLKDVI